MSNTIKAIPTKYAGHLFRSRTEARWAVFFDSLLLRWEYEPEGVVLPDGTWYLPDFWMPDMEVWVEIKPSGDVPFEAWEKAEGLAETSGHDVLMLNGIPWPQIYEMVGYGTEIGQDDIFRLSFGWDSKYTGYPGRTPHDKRPRVHWAPGGAPGSVYENDSVIIQMMVDARAKRFVVT